MTITIRNREVEDLVRQIGERTGEAPDQVMERLVRNEAAVSRPTPSEAEVQRRLARMEALRQKFAPAEPLASWLEVKEEMDAIYGDDLR